MRVITNIKFTEGEKEIMLNTLHMLSDISEEAAKDMELSQQVSTAFVAVSELLRRDPDGEYSYHTNGW